MIKTQLCELRSDKADNNYENTSSWEGHRCELCWKPIKNIDKATHIKVNDEVNMELPVDDNDVGPNTVTVPVGADCLRTLKRYAAEYSFSVIIAD